MWKLTDSEWKVLEALWAGGPQHLGQILGALAPGDRLEPHHRAHLPHPDGRQGAGIHGPVLPPAVRRHPQPGDVRRPGAAGSGGPGL